MLWYHRRQPEQVLGSNRFHRASHDVIPLPEEANYDRTYIPKVSRKRTSDSESLARANAAILVKRRISSAVTEVLSANPACISVNQNIYLSITNYSKTT